MKQKIKMMLSVVGMCFLFTAMIGVWPRTIEKRYEGVSFRLGTRSESAQTVSVVLDGKIRGNRLWGYQFKGKISIGDQIIPPDPYELDLKFEQEEKGEKWQVATLNYFYLEDGFTKQEVYGWISADGGLKHLMIQVAQQEDDGGKGWNSGDGWVVVAPASTKEEALSVCNQFFVEEGMKPYE